MFRPADGAETARLNAGLRYEPRVVQPTAATETIGWAGGWSPREPRNGEEEKSKIPPAQATSQYPDPPAAGTRSSTGAFSFVAPMDPSKPASPKAKIPPS